MTHWHCFNTLEREEEVSAWSGEGRGMTAYTNSTAHYSSVDAIHVMKDVVASGWGCIVVELADTFGGLAEITNYA